VLEVPRRTTLLRDAVLDLGDLVLEVLEQLGTRLLLVRIRRERVARVLLIGLVCASDLQVRTRLRTIDFQDPLLAAALGADQPVLGRTEPLPFSLLAQDALHDVVAAGGFFMIPRRSLRGAAFPACDSRAPGSGARRHSRGTPARRDGI